jgi:nitrite reductase/ring-hydroxylating ferredoxin subunit
LDARSVLQMEKQKRLSRKLFIRWMAGLSLGFATWIWYRLSFYQTDRESRLEFRHSQDIPLGISYFGRYYIFRNENSLRAFSTVCTHAGCRIGKGNGDTLQCGCHGSQFEGKTGKPIKGPAIKPLKELECRLDKKSGQWIVRFQPASKIVESV